MQAAMFMQYFDAYFNQVMPTSSTLANSIGFLSGNYLRAYVFHEVFPVPAVPRTSVGLK